MNQNLKEKKNTFLSHKHGDRRYKINKKITVLNNKIDIDLNTYSDK